MPIRGVHAYLGGAAVGAVCCLEVTLAAKTGAIIGLSAGPLGVAPGALLGGAIGVATYNVPRLYRTARHLLDFVGRGDASKSSSSSSAPSGAQRPQREAARAAERDRAALAQRDRASYGPASSGAGQDPDWFDNLKDFGDKEGWSPLERFKQIVQQIVARMANADVAERFQLCEIFVQAFRDLLTCHPDLVVSIDATTRQLVLTIPGGEDFVLHPDLIDQFGEAFRVQAASRSEVNLEQAASSSNEAQTCIYRIRCVKCDANYVGQTTDLRQRVRNHRCDVKNKDLSKSLYQHHVSHPCNFGCQHTLEDSYVFNVLMVFEEGTNYSTGLRAAEKFWQWLLKALIEDGGSGRQ